MKSHSLLWLLLFFITILPGCTSLPASSVAGPPMEPAAFIQSKKINLNTGAASLNNRPSQNKPDKPLKKAYLTFDDGPNSHFTPQILDILKKYGVTATFMAVGQNVEKNPAVLKRIVAEGHHVANHSYSHDYKKVYANPEAFLTDLQLCNQAISNTIGHPVNVFRPPGSPQNFKPPYQKLIFAHGYHLISWNVTGGDTDPRQVTPEEIFENIINGVKEVEKMKKTPIILLHDGTEIDFSQDKPGTIVHNYINNRKSDVAALPKIIEFLQARGYTFAGVDENTPPAW
ncbi:MAG: polysaccharide deacetylase [Peptococcaceae bacterium]|nr:MAG: polysaccharide deacetylase [Peptococcaceae bacterium]